MTEEQYEIKGKLKLSPIKEVELHRSMEWRITRQFRYVECPQGYKPQPLEWPMTGWLQIITLYIKGHHIVQSAFFSKSEHGCDDPDFDVLLLEHIKLLLNIMDKRVQRFKKIFE